jgi:hypothetical protein
MGDKGGTEPAVDYTFIESLRNSLFVHKEIKLAVETLWQDAII